MKKEEMKNMDVERIMTKAEEEAASWLARNAYYAFKDDIILSGDEMLLGDYLSILDTLNQVGNHRAAHLILVQLERTVFCDFIPLIRILCKPETEMLNIFVAHFLSTMYFDLHADEEDEDDEDFGMCGRMDDEFDCDGECDKCPFFEEEGSCTDCEPCRPMVRVTAEAEGCDELIAMMKEVVGGLGLALEKTEESAGDSDE